jgi:hypothetical protein
MKKSTQRNISRGTLTLGPPIKAKIVVSKIGTDAKIVKGKWTETKVTKRSVTKKAKPRKAKPKP